MITHLQEYGLTENEAKMYIALIDLGPSLAGQISRKTGLHRRSVYDTADMLIKKGLIGYIVQNNRRLFSASNPSRLIEILDEKKHSTLSVVDELSAKFALTKEKEETNFYKGKEGLKSVFEDQLLHKEVLILGASMKAYEVLQYYFKFYDERRKKQKISVKILSHDTRIKDIPLAQIRYLPEKQVNPMSVNIYGDKTAIILWSVHPIAIVIKNKEIANGYRTYFELLWNIAKK